MRDLTPVEIHAISGSFADSDMNFLNSIFAGAGLGGVIGTIWVTSIATGGDYMMLGNAIVIGIGLFGGAIVGASIGAFVAGVGTLAAYHHYA
ncbi:hypothetical protein [Candidatus Berkiella aquae]|uniref:Uncharacterized protein n=1 Tax=Candidatus Berkiella aquae TaxID=295108 RepID=A0A0Q9YYX6_9GAMM|nr:hypothetical protein [Candidatus Berkiella aquae]MCS5712623.1 hypothetical protein [Candidatus Berkiella aquae]